MIMRMRYMLHMVCETDLLWSYGRPQEADFGHGRHGLVLVWWLSAISLVLSTAQVSHLGRGIIYFIRFSQWQKNFKLVFAHHFDGTRHVQKVFFEVTNNCTNSDAWFAKKTDRKFRWEVTTKRCAKFENTLQNQMDGRYGRYTTPLIRIDQPRSAWRPVLCGLHLLFPYVSKFRLFFDSKIYDLRFSPSRCYLMYSSCLLSRISPCFSVSSVC